MQYEPEETERLMDEILRAVGIARELMQENEEDSVSLNLLINALESHLTVQ